MTKTIQPPPLPGDVVGEYRLEQLLGVGGMATVYRAVSEAQGWVAIKVLHPGKADTEEARRFRREFLTLRGLLHPHIVQVYESGRVGDYPWIAMELVEGTDLGTLIEAWQTDPPEDRFVRVERIFRQLCEALGYCHQRGLIHRDLKPSNVLVTRHGDAKLTDFGVVKAPGGVFTTQLTVAGKLVGTVAFMAPEQITGEAVDSRADLYSLGAVLYVMLTGTQPIRADSIAGYLARHLTENPKPPSELDPRVPQRLERVCLKLMAKEPSQRYDSIAEILSELDRENSARRRTLHGRDQVLSQLIRRMETLADGAGGVVILAGPSGIGKSALLDELAHRSGATGSAVAQISGMDPSPLASLSQQVQGGAAGQSLYSRIQNALESQPLTLLVDELEALPLDDLEELTRWVRHLVAIEGEPLLVVASTRDIHGIVSPFCTGMATGITPDILNLEALDRRAVVSMVRDMGMTGAAGAILGNRLRDHLAGNPGAVMEQMEALEEAGWLSRQPDASLKVHRNIASLRSDPLPLPRSIQEREMKRLVDLSTEARRIYDTLAVLEMEVSPGLVAEVAGLPMAACSRALSDLESRSLVRQWVDGVQEVVALLSSRQRDVVYALIDSDSRAALHRRSATALQRRFRRRLGAMSETIASHLIAGGSVAEAYPMLLDSAQRRFRGGRNTEAQQLLQRAKNLRSIAEVELGEDRSNRLRRQLFILDGQLMEHAGDLTGAAKAWAQALQAAQEAGDFTAVAQSQAGLGLVHAAHGEAAMAAEGLAIAIKQLPKGDPNWPRVAQALASARLEMGLLEEAEDLWKQLEELGRDTQASAVVAEAILGRGMAFMLRGNLEAGRIALEDAELRLRDQVRPLQLSRVLLELANWDWHKGDYSKASREPWKRNGSLVKSRESCTASMHWDWSLKRVLHWAGGQRAFRLPEMLRLWRAREDASIPCRSYWQRLRWLVLFAPRVSIERVWCSWVLRMFGNLSASRTLFGWCGRFVPGRWRFHNRKKPWRRPKRRWVVNRVDCHGWQPESNWIWPRRWSRRAVPLAFERPFAR